MRKNGLATLERKQKVANDELLQISADSIFDRSQSNDIDGIITAMNNNKNAEEQNQMKQS